jgi:hypothetical protein
MTHLLCTSLHKCDREKDAFGVPGKVEESFGGGGEIEMIVLRASFAEMSQSFKTAFNQCRFLSMTPALELAFPCHCPILRGKRFRINQTDRAVLEIICCASTIVVLLQTGIEVPC